MGMWRWEVRGGVVAREPRLCCGQRAGRREARSRRDKGASGNFRGNVMPIVMPQALMMHSTDVYLLYLLASTISYVLI